MVANNSCKKPARIAMLSGMSTKNRERLRVWAKTLYAFSGETSYSTYLLACYIAQSSEKCTWWSGTASDVTLGWSSRTPKPGMPINETFHSTLTLVTDKHAFHSLRYSRVCRVERRVHWRACARLGRLYGPVVCRLSPNGKENRDVAEERLHRVPVQFSTPRA